MTEDWDSWLELLEVPDGDATIWEVVVACPQCGMRQDFRGLDLRSARLLGRGRRGISAPPYAELM